MPPKIVDRIMHASTRALATSRLNKDDCITLPVRCKSLTASDRVTAGYTDLNRTAGLENIKKILCAPNFVLSSEMTYIFSKRNNVSYNHIQSWDVRRSVVANLSIYTQFPRRQGRNIALQICRQYTKFCRQFEIDNLCCLLMTLV